MISADSGLTAEAWKRRSGCEIGRGRIAVRGIWKNSPWCSKLSFDRGLDDDLRRLDKARPRLAHRNAEAFVLDARRAAAEAEHTAPAAEYVEQRDLFGDAHGVVPRQHDDRGAERDALGAAGVIRQQLGRRRRHRIAGEMVLKREDRVEAQRLGEIAHRQMLADHRGVRAPVLAQHVERDADFHGLPPAIGWAKVRPIGRPGQPSVRPSRRA